MTEKIGLEAIFDNNQFQKGMKDYLGSLKTASISTDISAASMGKSLLSGLGSFAWGAVKLGAMAVTGALVATGAALASTIKPASDLAESVNAVKVVFGEGADAMLDYSQQAATSVGLSSSEFNALATTTGAFLQNVGFDMNTAGDETIKLTERAADMASVFNTDVDEAMAAMQSGLKGEFNPLERFGVKLNAAAIEAKAVEMGLAKAGKEVSDTAKATAALELIYEQTSKTQGDFINTADGYANSQRVIAAQTKDLQARFGKTLLPILGKVQGAFSKFLDSKEFGTFINTITEGMTKFVDIAMKVVDALMKGDIKGALTAAFGPEVTGTILKVTDAIQKFGNWLSANWQPIAAGLVTVVLGLIIPAFSAWAVASWATASATIAAMAPIILPILAIGAAVALLVAAWNGNWFGIRDTLTAVWEGTLKPAFESVKAWLEVNIPIAIQTVSDFWNNTLLPAIQAVGNWITTNLVPVFESIGLWLSTNIPIAIQTVSDFWTNTLLPALTDVWSWISINLIPLFTAIGALITEVVLFAAQELSTFWTNTLSPAFVTVGGILTDTVFPAFQEVADVIAAVLQPIMDTAAAFINETLMPVLTALATFLTDNLKKGFDQVTNAIQFVIDKIREIIDWFRKLRNAVPPDFTPGSPPPFAYGMMDIGNAIKDVASVQLPKLTAALQFDARQMSPLLAMATGSTPAVTNNRTVNNTYNVGNNNISTPMDAAMFEARVLEIVGRAV